MGFRLVESNDFKKIHKRWWVIMFYRPHLYLTNLLLNAISMGLLVAVIYAVVNYYEMVHQQTIPAAFYSVIGVVLGLLLVFRTNTAYDRWWRARELFANFEAQVVHLVSKVKQRDLASNKQIGLLMCEAIDCMESYITKVATVEKRKGFFNAMYGIQQADKNGEYGLDGTVHNILMTFTSLERIRDTPIPTSYSLHIKVSIYLYFITMPFGLLYDLGYWSIPLTMVLYYVVAGIEIISNEIENPFYGDPNDLPVTTYLSRLKTEISTEL